MKHRRRAVVIILATLVVAAGLISLAVATSGGPARASRSRTAPPSTIRFAIDDRAFVARRVDRPDGSFVVQILDASTDAVLIESSRSANPVMRWPLVEDNGNVWFCSSDIGKYLFIWTDDAWEEVGWVAGTETSSRYRVPAAVFETWSKSDQERHAPFRQKSGQ